MAGMTISLRKIKKMIGRYNYVVSQRSNNVGKNQRVLWNRNKER